jgi:D-sedoheptulose 7-phosphate isomerase
MINYYKKYLQAHDEALSSLEITDIKGCSLDQEKGFEVLCELSAQIRDTERLKYIVGNGASAAFANHMALDWTKNGGVPTHSFSDSALLTALGNDLGNDEVFSAPLDWYAKSGDLLITISSSGNSPNIVKTIEVARSKGMGVVTLSGLKPDNASRQMGDINLYIPAKTYGIVECCHQVLLHVWLDKFMGITEWERDGFQNMRKDEFTL